MSTKAIFTFKDDSRGVYNVYNHWDGDPEYAYNKIKNALPYAWKLPRFEADEFSAAFIAGNKTEHGNFRCYIGNKADNPDIDFHYIVTLKDNELYIEAQVLQIEKKKYKWVTFFKGSFKEFKKAHKKLRE